MRFEYMYTRTHQQIQRYSTADRLQRLSAVLQVQVEGPHLEFCCPCPCPRDRVAPDMLLCGELSLGGEGGGVPAHRCSNE